MSRRDPIDLPDPGPAVVSPAVPAGRKGRERTSRGFVLAVASAVVLSTTAILIRHLIESYRLPVLVLAFWRNALVVITLACVLGVLHPRLLRIGPRHLRYLALYGFVLAVFNGLWTLSVALNGASVATLLVYSSAGFTAVLGRWLLRERLDRAMVLAILCSFAGCALVSEALGAAARWGNLPGIVIGLLSGLSYAAYSLMGRSAAHRGLDPWTTLLYVFAFAAGFLLLGNLLPGGLVAGDAGARADLFWLGEALAGWGILFVLAAGPTLLGFGLYNVSLGYLPASFANLILTLEPIFTAVIAYYLLNERLTWTQLVGGALILTGVVLAKIQHGGAATGSSTRIARDRTAKEHGRYGERLLRRTESS